MGRHEPRFEKDSKDVEFRPRSYRGPSQPSSSHSSEGFAWKIGVAVGVGVLAWNKGQSMFSDASVRLICTPIAVLRQRLVAGCLTTSGRQRRMSWLGHSGT